MKIKKIISLLLALVLVFANVINAFGIVYALPEDSEISPLFVVTNSIIPVISNENGDVVSTVSITVREKCRVEIDMDIQRSWNDSVWTTCVDRPAIAITTEDTCLTSYTMEDAATGYYYRLIADIDVYVNGVLKDSVSVESTSIYVS